MSKRDAIKLMVLDDEPFMLRLLERMLSQLGFASVLSCDNARQALQELDVPRDPPNLILLDLNMPGMDGVEFLRRLVERRYTGALILVSGEEEQILQSVETLAQAQQINSLGHLKKPFRPEALMALITKWKAAAGETSRIVRRAFGAGEVRAAIANGELVNYYQPKVAVATGELVGVEALVRWRHPTAGIVFPDQFIGVAESHGLIGQLTRGVLTAALSQLKLWRNDGLALHIAVNVSMQNLDSLGFPETVTSYAAAAGVSPQRVVLEVTESRLLEHLTTALDVLNRLRMNRFHLSIDDFGTGHSTFAQLADIPFDELKVDRSFVHGAATNAKLRAIYGASLALGKKLNMRVVAEGVEDREDWDFVRQTRCDVAQGYFIGRPMPAADLVVWLDDWQKRLPGEVLLNV